MIVPKVCEIEGVSGVGKTTLVNELKDRYGSQIEYYAFPTDRTILLKKPTVPDFLNLIAYHSMFVKDFVDNQYKIERAMDKGKLVIIDRYITSCLVYMFDDMIKYSFTFMQSVIPIGKTLDQIFLSPDAADIVLLQNLMNTFFNGEFMKALSLTKLHQPDRTIFMYHPNPPTKELKILQALYGTYLLRMRVDNLVRIRGLMPDTTETVLKRLKMLGCLL